MQLGKTSPTCLIDILSINAIAKSPIPEGLVQMQVFLLINQSFWNQWRKLSNNQFSVVVNQIPTHKQNAVKCFPSVQITSSPVGLLEWHKVKNLSIIWCSQFIWQSITDQILSDRSNMKFPDLHFMLNVVFVDLVLYLGVSYAHISVWSLKCTQLDKPHTLSYILAKMLNWNKQRRKTHYKNII